MNFKKVEVRETFIIGIENQKQLMDLTENSLLIAIQVFCLKLLLERIFSAIWILVEDRT